MLLTKNLYSSLVTYWYTVGNFRNVILGNIYQLPRQGRGWVCELYPKIYNIIIIYYIFWTYEGVVGCAFSVTDICYLESTCTILSLLLGVESNIIYFCDILQNYVSSFFSWYFAKILWNRQILASVFPVLRKKTKGKIRAWKYVHSVVWIGQSATDQLQLLDF